MTRVDFHFNVPDRIAYGCRLVRKIVRAGQQVVVWSDDANGLSSFDRALWTFAPLEFIPHVAAGDALAPDTPVLLACDDAPPTPHHDVLVNLGERTPPFFSRFERLIEVVSADDRVRALARERWRFSRDRGYPIDTHDLSASAARGEP